MSTHIAAQQGEIAPTVLMPGDPLRAKWIAETFLDEARCYTEVRGMYGYTGTWRGQQVSVQGSGMGQPSMAIYANELLRDYDVSSIIRVGSCGALTEKLGLRDLVIASGACTDSSMNRITFGGLRRRHPLDLAVDRADPGSRDDQHPAGRVGPTFLEPGLVGALQAEPVVRVPGECDVGQLLLVGLGHIDEALARPRR